MLKDYVIIDVETTGLSSQDRLIEIGILKINSNVIIDYYWSLINPKQAITDKIEQITGLTNDTLKDKPIFDDICTDILNFISNNIIIGYNIRFDIRMINSELLRLSLSPITNSFFDLYECVKRKFSNKLPNLQLGTICEYYNLSVKNAHRAIKDCCLVKNLYDKMYANFGESLYTTGRQ